VLLLLVLLLQQPRIRRRHRIQLPPQPLIPVVRHCTALTRLLALLTGQPQPLARVLRRQVCLLFRRCRIQVRHYLLERKLLISSLLNGRVFFFCARRITIESIELTFSNVNSRCGIPQFTIINFPDGGYLEVPLIGCSDDRPECCPSLNFTEFKPSQTGGDGDGDASASSSSSSTGAATTASPSSSDDDGNETPSWTGTTPSPTPTGVVSMLSEAPLTVCPRLVTILCLSRAVFSYSIRTQLHDDLLTLAHDGH
jgi:hypothetical protein